MKRHIKIILLIGLCTAAFSARSQVFQWKDPDTGATRFTNTAPSWYRNAYGENRGPRVQVFYYGVLVDDTGLAFDGRQSLRARSHIGRYLPALIPPTSLQARR